MRKFVEELLRTFRDNPDVGVVAVACIAACILLTYLIETEDEYQYNETYCANVHAYENNDGLYGWPDYKNIYDRVCK